MDPRRAEVRRSTTETKIELALDLDGTGRAEVQTGIGSTTCSSCSPTMAAST